MWEYDVALSFAGEDREYVERVALCLKFHGVKVFYDDFDKVELWGKDLYTYLSLLYKDRASYVVVFISEHYKRKPWAKHELRSAQARAFSEPDDYILPVRFDNTEIPGILPTTHYLDLNGMRPEQLAAMIVEKLNRRGKNSNATSVNTSEAYTVTPKFDLIVSDGQKRRHQHGEGEIWRNFHEINILSKPGRKVEIEINKAERVETKDALTITFIFGGHYYLYTNYNEVLEDFISEYKLDWISHRDAGRYVLWFIHGEKLLEFFPHLKEMDWLKNDFQAPPSYHMGARHGTSDPANSISIGFTLLEASGEEESLSSPIKFILDNYRFEDRDKLTAFLLDNEPKLEMLKRLVGCYKDYFGADAVMKLRVRPHGEDRIPKRSLLINIYTNNLMENDRPVIDRFIEECVKNRFGGEANPNEEDRILFQTKPLSQVNEVFPVYERPAFTDRLTWTQVIPVPLSHQKA